MKHLLVFLLLSVSVMFARADIITMQIPGAPVGLTMTIGTGVNALPLQDIRTNPNAVNITTHDDWYNNVPLGFNFPFFGQSFNNSWAATNGYVTFVDPQQSGLWGGCCQGIDLRTTTNPAYNYTIYGLHTDLYSWNGQNQYYLRGTNEMTYGWYNLSQCCSSQGGNSFEIKINSSGVIDTRISGAMVQWNAVTSGMSGNLANGEYYQYYHGQGLNIAPGSANIFSWNTNGATGAVDPCSSNPLSSPSCPGYQQAYETQQCSINPLYLPSCPGYYQAFHTQQCNINQLSFTDCPGYAAAYLNLQCTANALYSPSCPGYQQAYFNQQCSANALYSPSCPGYEAAYQAAQFAQACSNNPQISPRCSGYVTPTTTTTTTTTASATTTEPTTTYAIASSPTTTTNTQSTPTTGTTTTLSTSEPVTTVSVNSSGTLTSPTAVAVVADPVVNNVLTSSPTTTAVTATSAVAQSTTPQSSTSTTSTSTASASASSSSSSSSSGGGSSGQTQNTRAALVATLTRPGGASGMSGGNSTSGGSAPSQGQVTAAAGAAMKDGEVAGSMEQQKQIQNVVIGAMGYVPGFDVYNVALRDVAFYKPYSIYGNQRTIDNRAASRLLFGATDAKHNEMTSQQYQLGK
jgi:hypothetical protein